MATGFNQNAFLVNVVKNRHLPATLLYIFFFFFLQKHLYNPARDYRGNIMAYLLPQVRNE